ncbi:MAG: glycosyltransferase family 2 protein [bacterium]
MLLDFVIWVSLAALVYTFVGYPLLMAGWARLRPHPVRRAAITPPLTLLICAHNEEDVLERKLENALSLDYPKESLEILVVDDGSTDRTAEIVKRFADRGVRLESQHPRQGKSLAVNLGVARATGEIVVLSDASPDYATDALRNAVRHFADPDVGVVSGRIRLKDSASMVEVPAGLYWKYQELLCVWESATGTTVGVNGNLFAFRRVLFAPLAAETINDEFTVAMNIAKRGHRVLYDPEAVTHDIVSSSMSDEVARRARINAGRYQALLQTSFLSLDNVGLTFRLVSHKLSRPLAPLFMIGLLVACLVDSTRSEDVVAGALLGGQALLYGMAWVGWIAERRQWPKIRIVSVPYFFVSGNVAALIGLYRYVTGRQSVTWQKRTVASA